MTSPESPESPKRHWHGEPGARHEHQNVWLDGGGARGPAVTSPWSGWDADKKARRASEASTSSNKSASSDKKSLFENLQNQKRNSADQGVAARRKSYSEQVPSRGLISGWWHGYTKGNQ